MNFNLIPWDTEAYLIAADYQEEQGSLVSNAIRKGILPLDDGSGNGNGNGSCRIFNDITGNFVGNSWGIDSNYGIDGLGYGSGEGCGGGNSEGFGDGAGCSFIGGLKDTRGAAHGRGYGNGYG